MDRWDIERDELVINNVKISRDLTKQKDQYTIAITFIAVSLISLFNSFITESEDNRGIWRKKWAVTESSVKLQISESNSIEITHQRCF